MTPNDNDDIINKTSDPLQSGKDSGKLPDKEPLFLLPLMTPLDPVTYYRVKASTDKTEVSNEFPSLRRARTYGGNEELWARRAEGLQCARALFDLPDNPGDNMQTVGRAISRTCFATQLRALDEFGGSTCMAEIQIPDPTAPKAQLRTAPKVPFKVFSFQSAHYTVLRHLLDETRQISESSFHFSARNAPPVPEWPTFGGELERDFLSRNDLEVLGLAYIALVEDYLCELNRIHNFETGEPRAKEELRNIYPSSSLGPTKPRFTQSTSTTMPFPNRRGQESISAAAQHHYQRQQPYASGAKGQYSHSAVPSSSHGFPTRSRRVDEMFEDGYGHATGGSPGDPSDGL
ncbi:hypothetical protein MPER_05897 [Moniliophthora perniciosa FA553]|nr:hypothetical protein MPER_05897 [Moniliophthora perniciosa FA553]